MATRPASILTTESGKARAAGMPYDEQRAQLFSLLYGTLSSKFFKEILDKNGNESFFRLFSFFESYFSNYIEGTKFKVEEALEIVETGKIIPKRIIVPTVFREDYLLSLKRFSRLNDPSVYIRVMEKLQLFSSHIVGDNFDDVYGFLKESEAFEEPESGKL